MITFPNYHDVVPSLGHKNRAWRRRVAARYHQEPVRLPVPVAENWWPAFGAGFPRCFRWPLNAGRWWAARVLWLPGALLPPLAMSAVPERAPTWLEALVLVLSVAVAAVLNERRGLKPGVYYQRRIAVGFANLVAVSWLLTAALVGVVSAAIATVLLFVVWLPFTLAAAACKTVALWCGWLPPSTINAVDLAFLEAAQAFPVTRPAPASSGEAWHYNDDHDPHLRLDREHLAELRRANDLYERDLNGNRSSTVTAPQVAASAAPKRTAAPLAFIAAGVLAVVIGAYLVGSKASVPEAPAWPEIHAEAAK